MRFSAIGIAAVLASAVAVGCGDDGDNEASGNQTIGALTAAQVDGVCKSVRTKMERMQKAFISVTCTDAALLHEDACTAERAACITKPSDEVRLRAEGDFDCSTKSQESVTNDCPELTVDQLQGCLEAVAANAEATAASYTCSSDPNAVAAPVAPAACRDLEPVCPMLSDFSR